MSLARKAEPGSLNQEAVNQTCCSLLKRPLSVSICHVENDPIAVTFARVYAVVQLSGGILRSAGRLTDVFDRSSFTRGPPQDVFPPVPYHLSAQLRDELKLLCAMNYLLLEVQVSRRCWV